MMAVFKFLVLQKTEGIPGIGRRELKAKQHIPDRKTFY
jgi:hypothetical protein